MDTPARTCPPGFREVAQEGKRGSVLFFTAIALTTVADPLQQGDYGIREQPATSDTPPTLLPSPFDLRGDLARERAADWEAEEHCGV